MPRRISRIHWSFVAGWTVGLALASGGAWAQQPSPPRGPAAPPNDADRVHMMQGQGGRGMNLTDPAARSPLVPMESQRGVRLRDTRRPGEPLGSNIDASDCKSCHDRPAVPLGTHDDPASGFDGPELHRRSWAAWWEVNREPYLLEARSERPNPLEMPVATSSVVASLLRATESASPQLRGEAILSLGRMRSERGLEAMKRLTTDPDASCALRAWTAIGLLDSEAARAFLATPPSPEGIGRVGWTIAVGLLSSPTDAMWTIVREQVNDTHCSLEARRLALWALGKHHPPGTQDLLRGVIRTSNERELITQAIAGLPREPHPTDIKLLSEIASGSRETMNLPSIAQYEADPNVIAREQSVQAYYQTTPQFPDPFESASDELLETPPRPDRTAPPNRRNPNLARTTDPKLLQAREEYLYLREAAVRAIGEYEVVDAETRKTINSALFFGMQSLKRAFLPQDTLTVGRVGVLEDYYPLSDRLEVSPLWHPGFPEPTPEQRMRRPGRGSAAIAIGLLLDKLGGVRQTVPDMVVTYNDSPVQRGSEAVIRSGTTPRPLGSRTGTNSARRSGSRIVPNSITVPNMPGATLVARTAPDFALMSYFLAPGETSEVRSACVMALGLGNQTHRSAEIKRGLENPGPRDPSVFGYSMLSLALMDDTDALGLTYRQFRITRPTIDTKQLLSAHANPRPMPLGQILGRRAIAQGIAVLGEPQAIPMLIAQWGQNPAVDIEVARAIAWCHRGVSSARSKEAVDPAVMFGESLAGLLNSDAPPSLAASAAASLGALFDNNSAQRLDSIIAGQTSLSRGAPASSDGKLDLNLAPQQQVLGLANSHFYRTGFANLRNP